jgi:hypothetical protein
MADILNQLMQFGPEWIHDDQRAALARAPSYNLPPWLAAYHALTLAAPAMSTLMMQQPPAVIEREIEKLKRLGTELWRLRQGPGAAY